MNLIPKIRPGEEINVEKLNAIIDKVNNIETSKRELEIIRENIKSDMEKHNAILEGIKASQNVVQQIAQKDSLETLTSLLQQFISTNSKPSTEATQHWGMTKNPDGSVTIYLTEANGGTSTFTINQGTTGKQGPQGIQGPQGTQGPRGEIGPRGFRGVTGKQGEGASIKADYVNYVEDLSLLPSDLQQYLRIQIKHIDSEGTETLQNTCYIPTQGYIYLPEIYYDNDSAEDTAYIRFKKVVNTGSTAAGLLDQSWKVTGPIGPTGATGARGVPGTGLTVSNLIRLTDSHIFSRKTITSDNQDDTLETLLNNKETEAEQDTLIASLMEDVDTEDNLFGLIPLDANSIEDAHKFTFVEKFNGSWKLLRGVTFYTSAKTPINVYDSNTKEPKIENVLSQSITIGSSIYYKLIAGASFMHVPATDSAFKTYLYTVYERARLDTLTGSGDVSYYVLVKNTINAGIEIKNIDTDTFTANNITLPQNDTEKGVFSGRKLVVAEITPSKENTSIGTQDNYFDQAFINHIYANSVFTKYTSDWIFIPDDGNNPYYYEIPQDTLNELRGCLVIFKIVFNGSYVAYTPVLRFIEGSTTWKHLYNVVFYGFSYNNTSVGGRPVNAIFGWDDDSFFLDVQDALFPDVNAATKGVKIYYIKLS